MNNALQIPKGIEINQNVRFGKPVIKGTRIAVADILYLIEGGYNIKDIPNQYPTVSLSMAKKALRYAANILGKEEVLTISS